MSLGGKYPIARELANRIGAILGAVQFRGKWRLSHFVGGMLKLITSEADCYPVPGARVSVPLNDRIGRLMWTGCYELELVTFLQCMLGPGSTFVDVGCNIGYFSIIGAALVGESGAVHSFEPDPDCFSRLEQNSRAYAWVRAYHSAVADCVGEITFYRSNKTTESGWGTVFNDGTARPRLNVPVCTLDGCLANGQIEKIDVLKIDVEGGEYRVLLGGRTALEATRPVIWMEANQVCLSRDDRLVADLLTLLQEWRYSLLGLENPVLNSLGTIVAIPQERPQLIDRVERLPLGLRRVRLLDAAAGAAD
jgi:FkbM family methyltransferase